MNQTRPRKRKSVEVSAPTGQMSTTLPEYLLSSGWPGAVSMKLSFPRWATPSCGSLAISRMNRTQRVQRMQRSWSSVTCGPSQIRFPFTTLGTSSREGCRSKRHVVVLQLALAGLVADGAVDRVVEEQELQRGPLLVLHARRVGLDRHALGQRHLAGGHELAHGGVGHLHQAHPAVGRDGEPLVVAVVRDLEADALGRLDHGRPRLHHHLAPVDGGGDEARVPGRRRPGRLRAGRWGGLGLVVVCHSLLVARFP